MMVDEISQEHACEQDERRKQKAKRRKRRRQVSDEPGGDDIHLVDTKMHNKSEMRNLNLRPEAISSSLISFMLSFLLSLYLIIIVSGSSDQAEGMHTTNSDRSNITMSNDTDAGAQTNDNNTPPPSDEHSSEFKYILTFVYSIIFIVGVCGNICNCLVIADSRNRYMKTATNYYLFSLSISDLLLLTFGIPHDIVNLWHPSPYLFNSFVCISRGWISEASTNASVLVIVAFTVERYIAICHPLRVHTLSSLSRCIKIIIIIWLVASTCALIVVWQFGIQTTVIEEAVDINSLPAAERSQLARAGATDLSQPASSAFAAGKPEPANIANSLANVIESTVASVAARFAEPGTATEALARTDNSQFIEQSSQSSSSPSSSQSLSLSYSSPKDFSDVNSGRNNSVTPNKNVHYVVQRKSIAQCTTIALYEKIFEMSVLIFFIIPMTVITILYMKLGYHLRQKTSLIQQNRLNRERHMSQYKCHEEQTSFECSTNNGNINYSGSTSHQTVLPTDLVETSTALLPTTTNPPSHLEINSSLNSTFSDSMKETNSPCKHSGNTMSKNVATTIVSENFHFNSVNTVDKSHKNRGHQIRIKVISDEESENDKKVFGYENGFMQRVKRNARVIALRLFKTNGNKNSNRGEAQIIAGKTIYLDEIDACSRGNIKGSSDEQHCAKNKKQLIAQQTGDNLHLACVVMSGNGDQRGHSAHDKKERELPASSTPPAEPQGRRPQQESFDGESTFNRLNVHGAVGRRGTHQRASDFRCNNSGSTTLCREENSGEIPLSGEDNNHSLQTHDGSDEQSMAKLMKPNTSASTHQQLSLEAKTTNSTISMTCDCDKASPDLANTVEVSHATNVVRVGPFLGYKVCDEFSDRLAGQQRDCKREVSQTKITDQCVTTVNGPSASMETTTITSENFSENKIEISKSTNDPSCPFPPILSSPTPPAQAHNLQQQAPERKISLSLKPHQTEQSKPSTVPCSSRRQSSFTLNSTVNTASMKAVIKMLGK